MPDLRRRLVAEGLGTLLLLAAIVGSGIMAERLTDNIAVALLCNAVATGAMLFVIIAVFAPLSGAHFNPAVTLVVFLDRGIGGRDAVFYVLAQVAGGVVGVFLAHAMFGDAIFALGNTSRTGTAQWLSEAIASFGLILVILGLGKNRVETVAACVALYILAAYWFTASTSFANPAVTLARSLTPSFAGISPGDAPLFIAAQLIGAFFAWLCGRLLFPKPG